MFMIKNSYNNNYNTYIFHIFCHLYFTIYILLIYFYYHIFCLSFIYSIRRNLWFLHKNGKFYIFLLSFKIMKKKIRRKYRMCIK